MNSNEIIEILKTISAREKDSNLRQEIDDLIKNLETPVDGEDNNGTPVRRITKTKASEIVDVIARYFLRIGSTVIAKEIADHLHKLLS